ncbi:MAG: molybdenum cofactor biosynthesis protein MoaE [Planctomycetes bacterium]|nr:molybdenum cofactor biosynthesis protein MoaE [Planctomycetota bacterium]
MSEAASISVRLVFLGPSRDLAAAESTRVQLPAGATIADLRSWLAQEYPRLAAGLHTMRLAVNETFAHDSDVLHGGDEVALVPPVSGGSGQEEVWVDLLPGPIPVERVRRFLLNDPRLGGIVTFEGAARAEGDAGHGALLRLEYEAYESMARRQLERLAREAVTRWCAGRVAVLHRLGGVAVGEVSVVVAVATPHRAEAFEACRWLIDELKRHVPIWKKDVFADGFVRWVEPTAGDAQEVASDA